MGEQEKKGIGNNINKTTKPELNVKVLLARSPNAYTPTSSDTKGSWNRRRWWF